MHDLDFEERQHLDAAIAWLEANGPDDYHRVVLDFNWGEPLYLLAWIACRPDCDIATAQTIFWAAEPAAWMDEQDAIEEEPNGYSYLNRELCIAIAERVAAGGYTRSEINFEPDVWTKSAFVELENIQQGLSRPNFRNAAELIANRRGRTVENDADFYRRYPSHLHHSASIELPGDTPKSLDLMARVSEVEQTTRSNLPAWLRI